MFHVCEFVYEPALQLGLATYFIAFLHAFIASDSIILCLIRKKNIPYQFMLL